MTGWIAEVTARRTRWEIEMNRIQGRARLSRDQIATIVDQMAGLAALLDKADPRDRAEVYSQLGLRLTYQNTQRRVLAEIGPEEACTNSSVRGGTPALGPWPPLRAELVLS